jgi:LmbE family N-acetylglucosaminyl deacetylase
VSQLETGGSAAGEPQDPVPRRLRLPVAIPDGRPLRVLALGAHADDIEIGCGATVLRLVDEVPGVEIGWAVFSACGTRRAEGERGVELFAGAAAVHVEFHEFADSYFPAAFRELKDAMFGVRASFEPDVVLTHARDDAHQDHRMIAELTWNTWRDHLVMEYEIPKWDGDLGRPNCYVPLSRAQLDRKVEYLHDAFVSQKAKHWFAPSTFTGLAHVRGVECNALAAEAFTVRKLVL